MEFERTLKRYMSGDDVWAVKERLLDLGYLSKATHKKYGNDTYRAVKVFQEANNLAVDGVVGRLTWAALFGEEPTPPTPAPDIPGHITEKVASAISADLASVSDKRKETCLLALQYAVDPDNPIDLKCFYIRGGNLYNGDLSANVMTERKLNSYFKKTAYEPYYDGGREEMMREQAARNDYKICGCDCSGFIVGLWRKLKLVNTGFDATANSLYKNYCTQTNSPVPGDLCWLSGHIGIYVGGGYCAESAGGAYGLQLTAIKNRILWDYVSGKKTTRKKGWTAYGDPKYY